MPLSTCHLPGERSNRGRGDDDGDRRVRSPTADVSELDPADSLTAWVAALQEVGNAAGDKVWGRERWGRRRGMAAAMVKQKRPPELG
jgi:hypothetical protein